MGLAFKERLPGPLVSQFLINQQYYLLLASCPTLSRCKKDENGNSGHERHTVKWRRHNTLDKTAGKFTSELGLSVQPSGTDGKHVRRWTSMSSEDRRLRAGGDGAGRQ